jgi:urea transport system substrate-binding protein
VEPKLASLGVAVILVASLSACATDAGTTSAPPTGTQHHGPLTIGVVLDRTGPSGLFGPATANVAQLAVDQINAKGGVDGQQVALKIEDGKTDPGASKAAAQALIDQDGVTALFTMFSSAQSAAVAPVAHDANVPYFYAPVWQGDECLDGEYANGEVPNQQLAPTIPWVQKQTGDQKWYLLGDDYVWPRTSFKLAKAYIKKAGGEVVGEEYVPLGTTDFTASISKIKQSGANVMIPALVGSDAVAFEKQAYDAGLGNDAVQRLAILYEDNTRGAMGADVTSGMYFATGYDSSITLPENAAFLKAYHAAFGSDASTVTTLSEHLYVAIKAWAKAADAAGGTSPTEIASAMTSLKMDTPAGPVSYLGNGYAKQSIRVVQIQPDGSAKVVTTFDNVNPGQSCG